MHVNASSPALPIGTKGTHVARSFRFGIVTAALLALTAIAGCGLFSEKLATVNDPGGLFHVLYPESWQSFAQPGLIALYAADELPQDETAAFDTLSVGIYTASKAATEPVDARLRELLELRAKDRGWQSKSMGEPRPVNVGKRAATAIDVSGVDEKGRDFAGRAVLVRTNGREVLVFAVSPKDAWSSHAPAVDDLFGQWYWHVREDETSPTGDASPTTGTK